MNKRIKRVLALMLACMIVIGSVNNARFESRASAAGIIAGGGAATVGIGAAFPYLLGIAGALAGTVGIYKNREAIKEWGATQFDKFKIWASENADAWAADAATAGKAIDEWGEKLSSGTLDKASGAYTAFKQWLKDSVYSGGVNESGYNGYPTIGIGVSKTQELVNMSTGEIWTATFETWDDAPTIIFTIKNARGDYYETYAMTTQQGYCLIYNNGASKSYASYKVTYNGKTYYRTSAVSTMVQSVKSGIVNYMGDAAAQTYESMFLTVASWLEKGVVPGTGADTDVKDGDYILVGGLGGAGVLEGNWDVVGKRQKEGELEVTLPWLRNPAIDDVLDGVQTGEKTWEDVLEETQTGVIERTAEGDMVVDSDGVTTIPWEYAKDDTTTPDVDIPDTSDGGQAGKFADYTLVGLEKLFPFCLPFDAIDFVNILEAEPQAPHFTFPIKYPTKNGLETYNIDIDLSPFDAAAEILRDMECLLFIVGLIMITRSQMIRG